MIISNYIRLLQSNKLGGSFATQAQQWMLLFVFLLSSFQVAHAQLSATFTVKQPTCYGSANGTVTVTPSGGITPYTYAWSNGASGATVSNVKAGYYTITITDADSICVERGVTVNQPTPLTVTVTDSFDCVSPFTLVATIKGGILPYTYRWSNNQTTQRIDVTEPGTYTVTITDANACTGIGCITVNPVPLSVSAEVQGVTCPDGDDGTVSANLTGGTAPYTFLWSNGDTTQSIDSLSSGTYGVTVTDAEGCEASDSAVVINKPPLAISFDSTEVSCFNVNTGKITVSVSGGSGSYRYRWSNGATTSVISNLAAGTYTVTVTDKKGCQISQSITISQPTLLVATATKVDVNCFGGKTGSASVTGSGGTLPYTYKWSNNATTATISNLGAGTYNVTVTDAQGCTATASVTIVQPPAVVATISKVDVNCFGTNTGSATVTASGGTLPYTYKWSNNATTAAISNLTAGTYTVTVTDANGCTATASVTIAQPTLLVATATKVDVNCFDTNTGSATVTGSGGTLPYTYQWSNNATTQSISNLLAGTYTVTVMDARGCTATVSVTVAQPTLLVATATKVDVNCFGGKTGSATVTGSGGTLPYTYQWSNNATTATISNLGAGTYNVTVTDARGCTATASVTIVQPPAVVATISKVDVNCFGTNTGSATVTASGGTLPYTYKWSNNATTAAISNLTAGTYTVTVTDANGCTATASVTINQPKVVVATATKVDVNCFGGNTGSASVTGSGGTLPYTYQWSNNATTAAISNLTAGTYTVTVTDANGCTATATVTITQPPALTATINKVDVNCFSTNTGSATVVASGGTSPYTYKWSTNATTATISNLGAGTYTVTVTDKNACTTTATVTIAQPTLLVATATKVDVNCFGGKTGSASVTGSGGTLPYTYKWSNNATTATISNLGAGTYNVTVTDAQGCTATASVTIVQPPAVVATISKVDVNCFGTNTGSATVTGSGGTLPYTYKWSNNATTAAISNLIAGNYTVTVTDANGCTATASVTIIQPLQLTATITNINVNCFGQSTGSATVAVKGGKTPYTFKWSNNATTQTISNLLAGTYTVTVTDANQCTVESTVVIAQPAEALQVNLTTKNIVCSSQAIGSVTALVTGGTSPYSYKWSNNATTSSINNLAAGTYTVTVTDARGCTATATSVVTQVQNIALSITKTDILCFDANNGTATVTATGDVAPYVYNWSNGATTASISNLAPGTYTVTVTGSAGCTGTISVTITQPPKLNVTISQVNVKCEGGNGRATASVSGGKAPYTYAWSNGANTATVNNLAAGTYTVTVTDANGCTATNTVTIVQPPVLVISVEVVRGTCEGSKDGIIVATVQGGTLPYKLKWSNGSTNDTLTNVGAGIYTVTVTDKNGCTATAFVTLNAFQKPTCSIWTEDNDVRVKVVGGTAPYTYLWSNGQTTQSIGAVADGIYTITVTDANGCTTTCSAVVQNSACIGDFVWLDLDKDGIQDANEPGIPNITVIVTGLSGFSDTTKTNAQGRYVFKVLPDSYKVTFVKPANFIWTTYNAGNDDTKDSDADPNMSMTSFVTVQAGDSNLTLDAGFYEKCVNLNNAGKIGYDQYLCGPGNDPAPIVEIAAPSGGTGIIEYLWMKSTIGGVFSATTWEPIPNSNTKNYDPGLLFETTYFIRCTRRADCLFIETNPITIFVGNEVVAKIEGPEFVCTNTSVTFKATPVGGSSVQHEWDFGPAANPRFASGISPKVTFSSFGLFQIRLTVTGSNCTSVIEKLVSVNSNCGNFNLQVNPSDGKSTGVRVYPNPIKERLVIELSDTIDEEIQIQVINLNGTVLQKLQAPAKTTRQELDFSNIPAGSYFIRVQSGKTDVQVIKVVKN